MYAQVYKYLDRFWSTSFESFASICNTSTTVSYQVIPQYCWLHRRQHLHR